MKLNQPLIGRYCVWGATRLMMALKLSIIARLLPEQTLGQWFAMLAAVAVPVGLAKIGSREFLLRLKREEQFQSFGSALAAELMGGVFASFFAVAVWLPALIAGKSAPASYAMLCGLCYLNFNTFAVLPTALRETTGALHIPQIPLLASEIANVATSVALLIFTDMQLSAMILGGLVGTVLALATSFALAPPAPSLRPRKKVLGRIIAFGMPISFHSAVSALAASILMLALVHFHGSTSAAAYGLILGMGALISSPLSVLETAYYPSFAAAHDRVNELRRILKTSSWFFSLMSGIAGGFLIFNSHFIISLFAGNKWQHIQPLVQILGLQLVARFSSVYLYGHVTVAKSRTQEMSRWALLNLSLAASLGIWLTYRYGVKGAVLYELLHAIILIPAVRIPAIRNGLGDYKGIAPALIPFGIWATMLSLFWVTGKINPGGGVFFLLLYSGAMLILPTETGRPVLRIAK
jgi:O-antigen/teichoic acid export membrane protein